ncbi:MAG: 4Fe-4S dicluster domain-containing protein [Fibrobacter sp.]|nr:4Fe-4S dicluster domain-containing protein [Fibrobacter sp.]
MIKAKINGITVSVPEGTTILEAANKVQVKIPTLCKHPDLPPTSSCGICIVKIKGSNKMLRACCTPIEDNMEITTHDPEIVDVRRTVIELILSKHPNECLTCGRNGNCELQTLASDFGIRRESFPEVVPDLPSDTSTGTIVLDPRKCVSCGRCVSVCQQNQNVWALSFLERGFETRISPAGDISLGESPCVRCGQCSAHCPTGAIVENDETAKVWKAIQDPSIYSIVQIAPAVRVALGEAFGLKPGTNLTRKIYTALRRMGFEAVFDTNFGADLTIVEEGTEFIKRFTQEPETLPLITSCCPAWVDFMEKFHPDMKDNFSTCKSPQAMVGALAKTYYAQKRRLDPAKMFVVSIMPCTAKKYEIIRSNEMYASGHQDIDISITTRELARMIKQAGIDFVNLPDEDPDHILGEYSGAATIFGVTGGVMEAALRTAYDLITGGKLTNVEFENVRGLEGVKEGTVPIMGHNVKVAVAHGLKNVEYVINKVREAKKAGKELPYHFIEVMACPGGCVGGGGQPYGVTDELRRARAEGLYDEDHACTLRYSHENPFIKKLYEEYLGEPNGEKAHHLLHTTYVERPEYQK